MGRREGGGNATVRSRFADARRELLSTFASFGEEGGRSDDLPALYERLREILGFAGMGLSAERSGSVVRIGATGLTANAPLAIVEAVAVKDAEVLLAKGDALRPREADKTLLIPYDVDDKTQIVSVARLLSHLFVAADAPDFALVLAAARRWSPRRSGGPRVVTSRSTSSSCASAPRTSVAARSIAR
ncbi:hypothetical protein NKG05_11000 [Oerskovia sp. M15]